MKIKFRSWANQEPKFCRKLLHKNEKSNFCNISWIFFVENRYTVNQRRRKKYLHHLVWRPTPWPSHNSVITNHGIWKFYPYKTYNDFLKFCEMGYMLRKFQNFITKTKASNYGHWLWNTPISDISFSFVIFLQIVPMALLLHPGMHIAIM